MRRPTVGHVVADDCSNLRQGDVVELRELRLPVADGEFEIVATPAGVAILSQTCDVVQPSKQRCLVAPVFAHPTDAALSSARKGQKPLHLYLESGESGADRCIADIERAASILKSELSGTRIMARYVADSSGGQARAVAWRIGRAFSRFPFPDEVYPAFSRLRHQAQEKAGSAGNFGRVLDLVEDLRVSADQWASPGRRLTLYIVVAEERLVPSDEMDPNWQWDPSRITGLRSGELPSSLSLDRVCELLLANLDGDRTSLGHLWKTFGETVEAKLLTSSLDVEVVSFGVEVLSDSEMTYRQYQQTEGLDLEVLSDSTDTSS